LDNERKRGQAKKWAWTKADGKFSCQKQNKKPSFLLLLSYHKQKTEIKFRRRANKRTNHPRSFLSNQPIRFLVKQCSLVRKRQRKTSLHIRQTLFEKDWLGLEFEFSLTKLSSLHKMLVIRWSGPVRVESKCWASDRSLTLFASKQNIKRIFFFRWSDQALIWRWHNVNVQTWQKAISTTELEFEDSLEIPSISKKPNPHKNKKKNFVNFMKLYIYVAECTN